jgi:hypothetical protein
MKLRKKGRLVFVWLAVEVAAGFTFVGLARFGFWFSVVVALWMVAGAAAVAAWTYARKEGPSIPTGRNEEDIDIRDAQNEEVTS